MSDKIQIKKSVLAQQVEQGMKKDELATHYGVKVSEMTRILKQANLKIRKFHLPTYQFIDDTAIEVVETQEVTEEAIAETVETAEAVEVPEEEVVETQVVAEEVKVATTANNSQDWGSR